MEITSKGACLNADGSYCSDIELYSNKTVGPITFNIAFCRDITVYLPPKNENILKHSTYLSSQLHIIQQKGGMVHMRIIIGGFSSEISFQFN